MFNNKDFQYTLESNSTIVLKGRVQKFTCPSCGRSKKYVRYVDKGTRQYLPEKYGKCDRADNCAYHLNPYTDGYRDDNANCTPWEPKPIKPQVPTFIPSNIVRKLMSNEGDESVFITNLLHNISFPFVKEDVDFLRAMYQFGRIVATEFKGAVTLPYIDEDDNVRGIQVKLFDENNHTLKTTSIKYLLERYSNKTDFPWLENYGKNHGQFTCLFGAHLLKRYSNNPIFLVEAPKTALIGTLYFGFPVDGAPLWLATYNLSSLTYDRVKVLEGRKVWLYPDLSKTGSTFGSWQEKANHFNKIMSNTSFQVSDFLEEYANDEARLHGEDIADYLIQNNWINFRLCNQEEPIHSLIVEKMALKNPILNQLISQFDLVEE